MLDDAMPPHVRGRCRAEVSLKSRLDRGRPVEIGSHAHRCRCRNDGRACVMRMRELLKKWPGPLSWACTRRSSLKPTNAFEA